MIYCVKMIKYNKGINALRLSLITSSGGSHRSADMIYHTIYLALSEGKSNKLKCEIEKLRFIWPLARQ